MPFQEIARRWLAFCVLVAHHSVPVDIASTVVPTPVGRLEMAQKETGDSERMMSYKAIVPSDL